MDKKQTAVEWLIEQVNSSEYQRAFGQTYVSIELIEQAKEMEKEQIKSAHINGQSEWDYGAMRKEVIELSEQYYKQTYGKETDRT